MDKILRNIRDCVLAQIENRKIPNLFSYKFECKMGGDWMIAYLHFNQNDPLKNDLLHLNIHIDREIKRESFCWRKMKWNNTVIYEMRLTISGLKNTETKYLFTSKEKPIIIEIYNLINDYISYTQKKELNNMYKITKSDIDLINNNDITHNF